MMLDKILIALAAKLGPIIAKQLLALLPVISAAVAKALMDEVRQLLPNLSGLPGSIVGSGGHIIPDIDIGELAEKVRTAASDALPGDIDLPFISEVFDATEWLRNRK